MRGADFLADVVATGRINGIGTRASLAEVEAAFPLDHVDNLDRDRASLWRDYGLVEFVFDGGPKWLVVNVLLQVHRLATVPAVGDEWRSAFGVDFGPFVAWDDVREALSRHPDPPELIAGPEQSGYTEHRTRDARRSVLVLDSHEEWEGRPGHEDVHSVGFW